MFEDNFKKEDLVKDLTLKTGFSSSYSKKIINDLIKILGKNIKGGTLNLKNIGTFKVIYKKERLGRNPKTGEEFTISSRNALSFKPSKKISDKIKDKLW